MSTDTPTNTPRLFSVTYTIRRYVVDVSADLARSRVPTDPHGVLVSVGAEAALTVPEHHRNLRPLCATVGRAGWNHPEWTVEQWLEQGPAQAAERLRTLEAEMDRLSREAREIREAYGVEVADTVPDARPQLSPAPRPRTITYPTNGPEVA